MIRLVAPQRSACATGRATPSLLVLVVVASVLAFCLAPINWPAAPRWDVLVVDELGKPVQGMTVRETWYNYSVDRGQGTEDRQSDVDGRVTFPARRSRYTVLRRSRGTLSALRHSTVPSSYGPHANVFAFGKCLEGTAMTSGFATDWTGSPAHMQSRIIAKPMLHPCSIPNGATDGLSVTY